MKSQGRRKKQCLKLSKPLKIIHRAVRMSWSGKIRGLFMIGWVRTSWRSHPPSISHLSAHHFHRQSGWTFPSKLLPLCSGVSPEDGRAGPSAPASHLLNNEWFFFFKAAASCGMISWRLGGNAPVEWLKMLTEVSTRNLRFWVRVCGSLD